MATAHEWAGSKSFEFLNESNKSYIRCMNGRGKTALSLESLMSAEEPNAQPSTNQPEM